VPETWYDNLFDRSDAQRENQEEVYYRADGLPEFEGEENEIRWSPSTNMPQWAARTFGTAGTVRVGRVQEATEEDMRAEGCSCPLAGADARELSERYMHATLWDAEHPRFPWAGDPYTWVVELERKET
jgi:hypothetical protein